MTNRMGRKNPLPSPGAFILIMAIMVFGGMVLSMIFTPENWGTEERRVDPVEKGADQ